MAAILIQIGATFAAVLTIITVGWKIAKPHILEAIRDGLLCSKHDKMFTDIFNELEDLNKKKEKDFVALKKLSGENRVMMKSQIALLEHAETNNATGKMQAVRAELVNFIIDN